MSTTFIPIQVCDENGKYLGLADDPGEAIKKNQVRLVARVMLKNKKGQWLLQRRAEHMIAWPGRWDNSSAGHVDEGETPEQAAYREMKEEVGLTDVKLKYVLDKYYEGSQEFGIMHKLYNHVYLGEFNGQLSDLNIDQNEVAEVAWFRSEEIKKMITNNPELATDGLEFVAKEFGIL